MERATAIHPTQAVIVTTRDECDLRRIAERDVEAVVYDAPPSPWLADLAALVENGDFCVPRTVLTAVSRNELARWLDDHLPDAGGAFEVREGVYHDVLSLSDRLAESTGASRFMVRIFTDAPSTECGFHVDTVPPGAPTWGLLRVYNGGGTAYVHPDNVTSMQEFYGYLNRRERLERERREARLSGDAGAALQVEREIGALDSARPFLRRPDEVAVTPPGAIIAFKHLDIRQHWSAHPAGTAWIHCSPMSGAPRLVVNVTAPEPARRRPR